jgi:hypothetical protein
MLVAFSDTENELDFNPTATNTAGSVRLSSGSLIVGGLKSRQETLIWTDTSLYSMTFIGPPLTFALNLINEGAGLIAPKAAINSPVGVFFMSKNYRVVYKIMCFQISILLNLLNVTHHCTLNTLKFGFGMCQKKTARMRFRAT